MKKAIEILLEAKKNLETNIELDKKFIKIKENDLSQLYKNLEENVNKHSSIVELLELLETSNE